MLVWPLRGEAVLRPQGGAGAAGLIPPFVLSRCLGFWLALVRPVRLVHLPPTALVCVVLSPTRLTFTRYLGVAVVVPPGQVACGW